MIDEKDIPMPPLPEEETPEDESVLSTSGPVDEEVHQEPVKQEDSREENLRNLRELRAAERRDKERAERRAEQLEAELATYKRPASPATSRQRLDSDSLAEGRHFNSLQDEIDLLREEVASAKKASTSMSAETRLKIECPDIDSVCSAENIRQFAEENPELAYSFDQNPDLYTKGKAVYSLFKKLGFGGSKVDPNLANREAALRNSAKPRAVNAVRPQVAEGPLSKANAFEYDGKMSEELRKQTYKEMLDAARGL